jgi:23S rRNA pseudouridine2605 synthase
VLSEALLHPRKHVPKTYVAKVQGKFDVPELDQLRRGVTLDDGTKTAPAELFVLREEGTHTWLQITLQEGKNRQIHRMAEAIGRRVMRLSRISFAGIEVEGLRPGEYRPLQPSELAKLKRDYLNPGKRERANTARRGPLGDDAGAPEPAAAVRKATRRKASPRPPAPTSPRAKSPPRKRTKPQSN